MKLIILSSVLSALLLEILAEEVTIRNNCQWDIYVKSEFINSGHFWLGRGQTSGAIGVNRGGPGSHRSRVWAHMGCDAGGGNCDTWEGTVSLAEFGWDLDGWNWFDISMVDGYNIPVTMEPYNPNAGGNCNTPSCFFDLNACPGENRVYNKGLFVACQSLNRDAPTPYSDAIKRYCPGVYSWSKDDQAGMRDCRPGNPGLRIIFC